VRALIFIAGLVPLAAPALADTLRVPQGYETIQAAVDAAENEDVVLAPGGEHERDEGELVRKGVLRRLSASASPGRRSWHSIGPRLP